MKNYTHHFDIDGIDIFAVVWYEPGQEGSYEDPYIAPSHEIRTMWIGDQLLDPSTDLFCYIEEKIQEELGTPI